MTDDDKAIDRSGCFSDIDPSHEKRLVEQAERIKKTYLKMIIYSMAKCDEADITSGAVTEIISLLESDYAVLKGYADLPEFAKHFSDAHDYMSKAKGLLEENPQDATRLLMEADGSMEKIRMGHYIKENPEQEESLNKFLTTGHC